jgi:hypothetical protein
MASLREFLKSGRLGEIQVGMPTDQVIALLGPADDRSVRRKPVYLLRYGAVEFAFKPVPETSDSRLVSIAIHFGHPGRTLPPALQWTDCALSDETTIEAFLRLLADTGMEGHMHSSRDQEYLSLDSGASIVFVDGRLGSIHFSCADTKKRRKQMTVSLPEDAVQTLRKRAREEGVSLNSLVERMIQAGK